MINYNVNNIKTPKKVKGFGLLDSLVALAIFGTVLTLYVRQTEDINISKRAKNYATNSITEAKEFAKQLQTFIPANDPAYKKYVDSNGNNYKNLSYYEKYKTNLRTAPNSVITLAPQNWDSKYQTTNMFSESPCLALAYNASTDTMYGIMFYVADKEKTYKDKSKLIQRALLSLQGKGAAYVDSKIAQAVNQNRYGNNTLSPTSWSPNNLNTLVAGSSICGGKIATNSIIINMDLLPEFNQRLIAVSGLVKSTSQNNTNQTYLPNHLFNANTLKSNLSVDKVILSNGLTANESAMINVVGTNSKTLNIGNNQNDDNNTAFLVSSIQPNTSVVSGVACNPEDIGKVAITGAEDVSMLNKSLLSCTKNVTLCTTGYCYLPSKDNLVLFYAEAGKKLEDRNGTFICPNYAPFYKSSTLNGSSLNNVNVQVFLNSGGVTTGAAMNVIAYNGSQQSNYSIGNNNNFTMSNQYGSWNSVINFQFNTVSGGNAKSMMLTNKTPINKDFNGYSENVGVSIGNNTNLCSSACSSLNDVYSNEWFDLTQIASKYVVSPNNFGNITGLQTNQCACGRLNNNYFYGLALMSNVNSPGTFQSITCSNSPDYTIQ